MPVCTLLHVREDCIQEWKSTAESHGKGQRKGLFFVLTGY